MHAVLFLVFHRWLTGANGYMRLLLFCYDSLNERQKDHVKLIVGFVASVYLPMFLKIHLNPAASEGPENMLFCRNLLLSYKEHSEALFETSVKRFFSKSCAELA